jgi:glycosyltransferase involved in cell wall biosynthesis
MKNMKTYHIGIDGNEANVKERVGSNVYAWELLRSMYDYLEKEPLFTVTVYLSSPPLPDWPTARKGWDYRVITPDKLWTQWRLPWELYRRRDIDLFFSPGHYSPRWSPVPTVPTIMDLAFEYYPDFFRRKDQLQLHAWTRRSVRRARHIFAISESTKRDIVRHYGRRDSDITVIYPAVKKVKRVTAAETKRHLEKLGVSAPYIAYIGTIQPRKNIERLVGAFEKLAEKGWPGSLVLAGKIGWLGEPIAERIKNSPRRARIIQTGYVSDQEKTALIQEAECTALIGLYEGFGIPPLESLQLGTIPVVAHTSSLPEVVGSGGIFVDPLDEADIARRLEEVVKLPPGQRDKRLGQMLANASQFSWEHSGAKACQTLWGLLTRTRSL